MSVIILLFIKRLEQEEFILFSVVTFQRQWDVFRTMDNEV